MIHRNMHRIAMPRDAYHFVKSLLIPSPSVETILTKEYILEKFVMKY